MVSKSKYVEFMREFHKLTQDYGFNSRSLVVVGQNQLEEKIKSRQYKLDIFHPETHGSISAFKEFKQTSNLKLLWARMSSAVKTYELKPEEVASIAPDYCPVTGALIDYGYGLHRVTDNPFFRPGIDHKVAVGNGGRMLGDITNIQIVSQHFNTIKNYGTEIDALKWLIFEASKY